MIEIRIMGETGEEVINGVTDFFYLLHDPQNNQMQKRLLELTAEDAADNAPKQVQQPQQAPAPQTPQPPAQTAPQSQPVQQAPTQQTQLPAPPAQPQQMSFAPVAPVSAAPTYTREQIGVACAQAFGGNSPMRQNFVQLLQQYGVGSLTDLRDDQLDSFASAARQLGAKL